MLKNNLLTNLRGNPKLSMSPKKALMSPSSKKNHKGETKDNKNNKESQEKFMNNPSF